MSCCAFHHRLLHEGGFTMELLPDGEARFFRPDGRLVEEAPPIHKEWRNARAALSHRLRSQGITIDVPGSIPLWEGGPVDYGWTVEGLWEMRERGRSPEQASWDALSAHGRWICDTSTAPGTPVETVSCLPEP